MTPEDQQQQSDMAANSRAALENDVALIDKAMAVLIKEDARLKHIYVLITSVIGIGRITGIHFLVYTNEFLNFDDPRKFASYAGVAPFQTSSGLISRNAMVSHFANKKMKKAVHKSALAAIGHDPN